MNDSYNIDFFITGCRSLDDINRDLVRPYHINSQL